jgi:phage-related minor tail protein
VIRSMRLFNIDVADAERVTDGYTRAANNSTASVAQLIDGMNNVGPLAKSFGLDFEEVVAILARFNDAGITGAEAGTQLKSMLTNLTRPTEEVQAVLKELGVNLVDNTGKFRSLNDIINDISSSFSEVKTVQYRVSNVTADQRGLLSEAEKAYASASRQIALYNAGLTTGAVNGESSQRQLARYQQVQANAQAAIAEVTGSQAEAEYVTAQITRGQAENFQAISQLAGSFGQAGLTVLLAEGEDSINSFIEEMNGLPGAAQIASEMMNTFKGRCCPCLTMSLLL